MIQQKYYNKDTTQRCDNNTTIKTTNDATIILQ